MADFADIFRSTVAIAAAAEGIDVEATAPGIAGVDGERLGCAMLLDVGEYPLDTLLVNSL